MTSSPSRRLYSNYHYTQTRDQNNPFNSINNLQNISQRTPQIHSPRLNAESQTNHQYKNKLDNILRHNSQLLNQNALLSEMVNSLKVELSIKSENNDLIVEHTNRQMFEALQTVKTNHVLHQRQVSKLLEQISGLHERSYQIQVSKNGEIKALKEKYEKQLAAQTILIKKANEDGKEIMQLQIKKLKETIELKDYEMQALKLKTKKQVQQAISENGSLKNEIKHIQQMNKIEIYQISNRNKQQLSSTLKQFERENSINSVHLQNNIKKLKKELINKNIEIEQKNKTLSQNQQQSQSQIHSAKADKEKLLSQLKQLQDYYSNTLIKEKQKINELAEMQKQNITNINETEKDCLRSEISKLNAMCYAKSNQIKTLYQTLQNQKLTYFAEIERLENLVTQLRKKINEMQADNIEELELLKIKMAHLHNADVQSLQNYYENQIAALIKANQDMNNLNDENRQKIHQLLQKNDEIRKNFQVQISKQKARVQDLKVKLASIQVQHKEQIASIGTKMELTSMTLIRETDQKHKTQVFFEAEKKKLYAIIDSKDREVKSVNEMIQKIRELHNMQKQANKKEQDELRKIIEQKDEQMIVYQKSMEEQFQKRKQRLLEGVKKEPDEQLYQQNKQLKKKIETSEAEIFSKQKQLDFLKKEIKSLQQDLGLRAGFIQTIQLESQAAIQDQKSKLKILMNENQVSLKTYFQEKLASRDRDNNNLRVQLSERQTQIRQLIVKYHALEKRLQMLMEGENTLRDLEQKVIHMGLDQNLVKNVAQLFARYRKSSSQ